MNDFWKIASLIGVGGVVAFFGLVFTIKGAVDQSRNNSTILSCENLQDFARSETDKHWMACLIHGNTSWECCRSCQ